MATVEVGVTVADLPDVVLQKVMSYLDYRDLNRLCMTCQKLQDSDVAEIQWKKFCKVYWLQYKCPKRRSWKNHFKKWFTDFGIYINVYAVVRRAWDKIEAFTKKHIPVVHSDLNDGVSDAELNRLERENKVKYPDDMRCSYRIHNGQKTNDSNREKPGLMGGIYSSDMLEFYWNETLAPIGVTYQWLDNPEDFSDLHILSFCYFHRTAQTIALNDCGGHTPGQVFYAVPDVSVLNSGRGIFMEDKFITANSFTQWLTSYADALEKNCYSVVDGYISRLYHNPSWEATTHNVKVKAAMTFMPTHSTLHPAHYSFKCGISLENKREGPEGSTYQLLKCHMKLTEGEVGEQTIYMGPQITGQFQVLEPGQTTHLSSLVSLSTNHGTMKGHFTLKNLAAGGTFHVACPSFQITCPPFQRWEDRKEIVEQRMIHQRENNLPQSKDVFELEMYERGQCWGFTEHDANELLCYGVKPWEDDAFNFLEQLHAAREMAESSSDNHEEDCDDEPEDEEEEFGFSAFDVNELLSYGVKPWDDDAHNFLEQLHAAREEADACEEAENHDAGEEVNNYEEGSHQAGVYEEVKAAENGDESHDAAGEFEDIEAGENEEFGGFSGSDVNELLSYGVKPWDDDASNFLEQLTAAREEAEAYSEEDESHDAGEEAGEVESHDAGEEAESHDAGEIESHGAGEAESHDAGENEDESHDAGEYEDGEAGQYEDEMYDAEEYSNEDDDDDY